jgi:hypothetical protein
MYTIKEEAMRGVSDSAGSPRHGPDSQQGSAAVFRETSDLEAGRDSAKKNS